MKTRFTISVIQTLCWALLLAGCNPEDPKMELLEIRYTTNDGRPIEFSTSAWEREPFYHGYKDNTGVLVFDAPITSIGDEAFYGCRGLTTISIPNSVTKIGNNAFRFCTSLTSITIPDSVTEIGEGAFCLCHGLTSITIPESVTTIGERAFYWCTGLTSVYCMPTTPPTGDAYMFDDNASDRKIYVPKESVAAYKSATYWSRYADVIVGYDF